MLTNVATAAADGVADAVAIAAILCTFSRFDFIACHFILFFIFAQLKSIERKRNKNAGKKNGRSAAVAARELLKC